MVLLCHRHHIFDKYEFVTEFDKTNLPHTSNYSPINTRNFMINDGIDPDILLYLSIS